MRKEDEVSAKVESGVHPLLRNAPKSVRFAVFLGVVVAFFGCNLYLAYLFHSFSMQLPDQMKVWGAYVAPKIACLFDFETTHRFYEFVYQRPYPTGKRLQDVLQSEPLFWEWGIGMSYMLAITVIGVTGAGLRKVNFFLGKYCISSAPNVGGQPRVKV